MKESVNAHGRFLSCPFVSITPGPGQRTILLMHIDLSTFTFICRLKVSMVGISVDLHSICAFARLFNRNFPKLW